MLYTYLALVRRDLIVIKKRFGGLMINAAIQVGIYVLMFGSLFPIMGMSTAIIAPMILGAQGREIMHLGMGFGLRILFDLTYSRFIDYHLTLPLPTWALFAAYMTTYVIETALITLPLLTIGIYLLGAKFVIIHANIPLFMLMYLLTLLFYGGLFLGLSLYYDYSWFMQNLWPRRLTFLITLSPLLTIFKRVESFSPFFAKLMLINPLTYLIEGMRTALIGGTDYLPLSICLPMGIVSVLLSFYFVHIGIKKRLDPV